MFLRNTLHYFSLTINRDEAKAHTNTHNCMYNFSCMFFHEMLEATAILSASFNLFRDSLSGRWCVCGQNSVMQDTTPAATCECEGPRKRNAR